MSNISYRTGEESPSSDEKMDTGSDTFHSQDTPNSDSDDPENIRNPQVLRLTAPDPQDTNSTQSSDSDDFENALQNPEDTGLIEPSNKTSTPMPGYKQDTSTLPSDCDDPGNILRNPQVLRLSEPRLVESLSDSLITKISPNYIDSPKTIPKTHIDSEIRPQNHFDSEIRPQNHFDSEIRPKNHFDSEIRPQNHFDSEIQPKNHFDLEIRPQNHFDSEIRPQNNFDSEIRPKNHFDSEIRPINHIDSEIQPQNLGNSPPKFCSTLTLATSHPLMGLGSPEDYPDLIPKRVHKTEEDKELSLSSIEDERHYNHGFYNQQRNTSKNNLYFSENFVNAESHILTDNSDLPPDVARVKVERQKLVPKLEKDHWSLGRNFDGIKIDCAMKTASQSIPESEQPVDVSQEFHSGVDWSESPSQLRAIPNFQLPIEMSTSIASNKDKHSPDVISSSSQDKSIYQAMLDPYTGSVALRHTPRIPNIPLAPVSPARRKIQLPVDDDCCSLDSLSDASLESEEEPVHLGNAPQCEPRTCDPHQCDQICSDDDDTKRSKSTNTVSYSDTIPEYSAAEELSNERAWLSVRDGQRRVCDMKVIEPYKRVVSHGGYSGGLALVVFSACHLPDNSRQDYTYVMDNLFLYVIWTLERLVTDEYILVYLHGSAGRRRLPTFHWLHQCYKLIDRRLRKNLKHMYLVHPTFWLKSFVILTKPFISSKFLKKMSYVKSLDELMETVPVEPNAIPEIVKQFDANRKR